MGYMDWCGSVTDWYKECAKCEIGFWVVAENRGSAYEFMKEFFGPDTKSPDGLEYGCRSCMMRQRRGRIGSTHRDELLKAQNYMCAICQQVIKVIGISDGYVDHDHITKKERGILCNRCNVRMSGVDDDEWLSKAIAYRDSFRCA